MTMMMIMKKKAKYLKFIDDILDCFIMRKRESKFGYRFISFMPMAIVNLGISDKTLN